MYEIIKVENLKEFPGVFYHELRLLIILIAKKVPLVGCFFSWVSYFTKIIKVEGIVCRWGQIKYDQAQESEKRIYLIF